MDTQGCPQAGPATCAFSVASGPEVAMDELFVDLTVLRATERRLARVE